MKLGEILKDYRERTGISMQTFADRCGMTKGYISMLERDVNSATGKSITPSLETLYKVSKGMGISIDDLMELLDPDSTVKLGDPPDGWFLLSSADRDKAQAYIDFLLYRSRK